MYKNNAGHLVEQEDNVRIGPFTAPVNKNVQYSKPEVDGALSSALNDVRLIRYSIRERHLFNVFHAYNHAAEFVGHVSGGGGSSRNKCSATIRYSRSL